MRPLLPLVNMLQLEGRHCWVPGSVNSPPGGTTPSCAHDSRPRRRLSSSVALNLRGTTVSSGLLLGPRWWV